MNATDNYIGEIILSEGHYKMYATNKVDIAIYKDGEYCCRRNNIIEAVKYIMA